jgi:hypothetical protein
VTCSVSLRVPVSVLVGPRLVSVPLGLDHFPLFGVVSLYGRDRVSAWVQRQHLFNIIVAGPDHTCFSVFV